MDGARNQFLANSALPLDEYRSTGGSNHLDELIDFGHVLSLANQSAELLLHFHSLPEAQIVFGERLLLENPIDQNRQPLLVDRLFNVIIRSFAHRLYCGVHGPVGGHDDNFDRAVCRFDLTEQRQSVGTGHS